MGYPPEGVAGNIGGSSTIPSEELSGGVRLSSAGGGNNAPSGISNSVSGGYNSNSAGPIVKPNGVDENGQNYAKSDYSSVVAMLANGNAEKLTNFSLVSYVLANQLAAAVQLVKNLNAAASSEHLLLYDLGLSAEDQRTMQKYCYPIMNASSLNAAVTFASAPSAGLNQPSQQQQQPAPHQTGRPPVRLVNLLYNEASGGFNAAASGASGYNSYSVVQSGSNSNNNNNINISQVGVVASKCLLIKFDLVAHGFPSYVIDDAQMHAFRPLIVRDALRHWSRMVLFVENSVRLRANSGSDLSELRRQVEASASGVKGWRTEPTMAVSSRTHLKMYEYFHTDDDNFKFLKMLSLDAMFFADRPAVNQRILLPWIKCALIPECIHPIGK